MNESEEFLLERFEQLINLNHKNIPKLLDLENQIVQFDVKDTALPGHFKIVLSDNEKGGAQLFLNNHLTNIHFEDSFADFKFIKVMKEQSNYLRWKKGDLEKQILQDVYEHDISFVNFDGNQELFEKEMADVGYKHAFDKDNQQQKNPFTSTFTYDYLTNEYLGVNSSAVPLITYKNYSTDSSQDNSSLAVKPEQEQIQESKIDSIADEMNKQKKYSSTDSIANDFSFLGSQVEQYFSELKNKQEKIANYNKFPNEDYLTIEQICKISKFERILAIFQKAKLKETKKIESFSNQKKNLDPEQIFKQLKSEWEEEQKDEEEKYKLPELQILAHLDFDTMIEKIEEKIQYQEQIEEEKLRKYQKEYNSYHFDIEENKMRDEGFETNSIFNQIKLGDQADIIEKKLQLTSRYEWATEDNFSISLFEQAVPKEKMAQKYPFELDGFQKRSVYRMERGESVFVCAHTSAGKTVVAEYAISLSKKINRKAIYTSPIKALSNQKYRDFKLKYGDDVGLVTGDVSINPSASCLIVTTEILRNMLYKNHDIIRDIEWVIFDEVHYVNNPERGVVWEETIIMLPDSVGFVMLSATVPNYMEFANWVGRTKKRKIFVQKTDYRPVPLEHSLYVDGQIMVIKQGDDAFNPTHYEQVRQQIFKNYEQSQQSLLSSKRKQKLEKIQKGTFKNTNTSIRNKRTMKAVTEKYIKTTDDDDYNDSSQTSEGFALMQLLVKCSQEQLLPCVIFVFSKRKIEELYSQIAQLNFCDYEESVIIEKYFKKCARKIKQRDLNVPQIQTIKQLLLRGIGVHHGDVIPFLKEVVEILFSQGLIKVLLATETFAMGINMPTKTVIFHTLKKYDSQSMRLLNSSEFTQMSGRAGRRGLDTKGNVIIFVQSVGQLPTKQDLSVILDHRGQVLESKFKISYETIINLLNSNVLNVIDMMKRSYQENHKYAQLPNNIKKLKELKSRYLELSKFKCIKQPPSIDLPPIEDYIKKSSEMKTFSLNYFAQDRDHIVLKMELPSFCVIYDHDFKFHLGMIIYINPADKYKERFMYVLYVNKLNAPECPVFNFQEDKYEFHVVENHHFCAEKTFEEYTYKIYKLSLGCIVKIFNDDPEIDDGELEDQTYIQECVQKLIDKSKSFKEVFLSEKISKTKMKRKQFLDMKFKATEISKEALDQNLDNIYESLCHSCEIKSDHIRQVMEKKQVKADLEELIKKIDENDLNQKCSFENKLKILKEFKYVDQNNKPTFKARVFKEIQNLYVTELVFYDYFDFLDEAEIAALLSGFVCQGKAKNNKFDPLEDLDQSMNNYMIFIDTYKLIIENVQEIIKAEMRHGIIIVASENEHLYDTVYIRDLMDVVLNWMNGADFQYICNMTTIQEGAIVKSFLRLENLLKNVRNGYKIMGNYGMSQKMDRCMEILKKDIIFSKSLYLDQDQ